LASASASLYPAFVDDLQRESGVTVDLRKQGKILFLASAGTSGNHGQAPPEGALSAEELRGLEPSFKACQRPAVYLQESSVDPRALVASAVSTAERRQIDIVSGTSATEIVVEQGHITGVRTEKALYAASAVINCAGAWAGALGGARFPIRPVKGQMLCFAGGPRLSHVIQAPEVYLVPRSDGRILAGASVEEAGYDKRIDPSIIARLQAAALELLPELSQARQLEAWAGLRPGTPDNLPLLGATELPGYYVAAGHFRDGILLAPVTARVMAQVVCSTAVDYDISRFSPRRFLC
jgi:glycine oxidase